jgi:hypothetical protein
MLGVPDYVAVAIIIAATFIFFNRAWRHIIEAWIGVSAIGCAGSRENNQVQSCVESSILQNRIAAVADSRWRRRYRRHFDLFIDDKRQ